MNSYPMQFAVKFEGSKDDEDLKANTYQSY
jgi:hypothetical protein